MAHDNTKMFWEYEYVQRPCDADDFSDQSSPMSSISSSPVQSPTADIPYTYSPILSMNQYNGSYNGYMETPNPVYATLQPMDGTGLQFDEMKCEVSETCQRQQYGKGDIQVWKTPDDFVACLGGIQYSIDIDPLKTFELFQTCQTQVKSIPVTATEKSYPYCSAPRRSTGHTGSGRNRKLPRAERLWEFILRLVLDPNYNPSLIEWVDRDRGMFRLVNSRQIARMWGKRKNNLDMTYEKLSRAMRYYYHRKILQPVFGKKLVYKFGPNSVGWQITTPQTTPHTTQQSNQIYTTQYEVTAGS